MLVEVFMRQGGEEGIPTKFKSVSNNSADISEQRKAKQMSVSGCLGLFPLLKCGASFLKTKQFFLLQCKGCVQLTVY